MTDGRTATKEPGSQEFAFESGFSPTHRISVLLDCDTVLREAAVRKLLAKLGWTVHSSAAAGRERPCDIWLLISSGESRNDPLMPLSRPEANATIVIGPPSRRDDLIRTLDEGVDDFLTLPIDPAELQARLRAVSRRIKTKPPSFDENSVAVSGHVLETESLRLVSDSGDHLQLSQIEFEIVRALGRFPGRTLSRSQILDLAYGVGISVSDRVVDYHICNIRNKLANSRLNIKVTTQRGRGYVLEKPEGGAK